MKLMLMLPVVLLLALCLAISPVGAVVATPVVSYDFGVSYLASEVVAVPCDPVCLFERVVIDPGISVACGDDVISLVSVPGFLKHSWSVVGVIPQSRSSGGCLFKTVSKSITPRDVMVTAAPGRGLPFEFF